MTEMGIWEIEIEIVPVDGICGGARSLQRASGVVFVLCEERCRWTASGRGR